jgi:hypothetical protein
MGCRGAKQRDPTHQEGKEDQENQKSDSDYDSACTCKLTPQQLSTNIELTSVKGW